MNLSPQKEQPFTPPTAEQIRTHFDRYPPRGPSKLMTWLPMTALAVALLVSMSIESNWAAILPWLTVGVLFFGLAARIHRAKQLESRITQIQEWVMLHHWVPALRAAWRLLPSLVTLPSMHGRVVAMIAHCLDQIKSYDAAITAYDYLIDRLPTNDLLSIQLRLHRSISLLVNDQLTDADDALRKIRGHTDALNHPGLNATYRLAGIVQQTRTNHWSAAADQANPELVDQLRPLGIDAGYGYALVALSHYKVNEPLEQPTTDYTAYWWSLATLLLPTSTLVYRFAELDQLTHLPSLMPSCSTPPTDTPNQA